MPRNAKLTDEERMSAVQEYLDGKGTLPGIAQKYGVSYSEFRRLVWGGISYTITPPIFR